MMLSTRWLALAVLLPAVCACSSLSSSRRPPNAVTLRFAWPEHFSARVSYSFTMKGPLGDNEVHRRYWLTVEPAKEKGIHRLVPRDIEVFPPEYAGIVDPVPTVRFDDAGAFQGVELPEAMPGQQLLESLPLEPEKRARVLQDLVAKQEQSARDEWERMVEHWRGATLVPGEPVRLESKIVVGAGMQEEKEVAAEELYSIEVGVPCSEDEQARRCVRLSVEVKSVEPSADGSGPLARWRFELVTEPDTLVPHSTRLMRVDRVEREEGAAQPPEELTQVEEYSFSYGAVPAGSPPP